MRAGRTTRFSGCYATAFTLVEVVMATAIAILLASGIIYGYVLAVKRAEWSAYTLAAHSLAMQRVEQTRSAKWDPRGYPAVDELVSSNFPVRVEILDIPVSGTNIVYATNTTTIVNLSADPPLKMVTVVCTWPFLSRGTFSNVVVTYRAPDQ